VQGSPLPPAAQAIIIRPLVSIPLTTVRQNRLIWPLRGKFRLRKGRFALTVCVAAIAAKSEALVLISDKAVTRGYMVSDTAICKMSRIADSPWHALVSGDLSICDEVLLRSEEALAKKQSDAESYVSMMRLVSKAYADAYEAHLVAQTLTPKLLTKDDLVNRPRRVLPLSDKLQDEIAEDRKTFERDYWRCDVLVCGFEPSSGSPRLFRVLSPGTSFSENRLGYTAVGIGEDAAIGHLMWFESDRSDDLDMVLWDAFDAKVHAEIMTGVGYKWDAHIIVKAKPNEAIRVPDSLQKLMDKAMNHINCSPFDREPEPPEEIPDADWKEQITRFTQTLIPNTVKPDEGKAEEPASASDIKPEKKES